MLTENKFKKPRLYHVVFMGTEIKKHYQAAIKALCFELRRKDIDVEWKGCLEDEKEEGKGLHFHVFMLVEADFINPCSILNHKHNGWLDLMTKRRELTFHICKPQNPMHQGKDGQKWNYATLAGDKLEDCINWIAYLAKNRSKSPYMRHIYFGSRNRTKPEKCTSRSNAAIYAV